MFGPVVGTSAGTVGVTGAGVVAIEEVVGTGVLGVLEVCAGVWAGGVDELVQAATLAAPSRHAAIARILRTPR
jgi:hypothetical protein